MSFTSADLDAIDRAIAAGELSIALGDMRITYRSIDELLAARDRIAGILAEESAPGRPSPRHRLADFSDDTE